MKTANKVLTIIAGILFFSMMGIIYYMTPIMLNSDAAFYILLAKEQLSQESLFPDGMLYSTALFMFGWHLFMIPLLRLFPEHTIRIKDIAEGIIWAMIPVITILTLRINNNSGTTTNNHSRFWNRIIKYNYLPPLLCIILLTIPYVRSAATDEYMIFAQYLMHIFWNLFILWIARTMQESLYHPDYKLRCILCMIGGFIGVLIPNLGSYRSVLTITIPLIAALILTTLMPIPAKNDSSSLSSDDRHAPVIYRRLWIEIAVIILGTIIALISYRILSKQYWSVSSQHPFDAVASDLIMDNIEAAIESFFAITGNNTNYPLVSPGGFMKCVNFIYCILLFGVIPILGIKNYKRVKHPFSRFVIAYVWISNTLLFFIAIIIGRADIPRYFLNIYLDNIILAAVLIGEFLESPSVHKHIRTGLLSLIVIYAISNHTFFWYDQILTKDYDGPQSLVLFLEDHELDYGYATYWNAHKYTILSGGSTQINNISINNQNIAPHKWLTNLHYYDPEYHHGSTFLMLTTEESAKYFPDGIEQSKYGEPQDILTFGYHTFVQKDYPEYEYVEYVIYVFDYNIMEK